MKNLLLSAVVLTICSSASAYSVDGGDLLVRPVLGASVNALRLDVATRESPPGGLLMGVDLDYSFNGPLNITGAIRPVFYPGFADVQLGLGVKYRFTQLKTPFVPYGSAMATLAGASKLRWASALHSNLGVRVALGLDYFVTRHLAVGIEAGAETSILVTPLFYPEATLEALIGVSYRFDIL